VLTTLVRTSLATGAAAALAVGALGVAPAADAATSTPGESQAPAGEVVVIPGTAASVTTRAAAAVAAMSLNERAASVIMGHIPTTDRGVLRDYMATTGVGGFILMGANVPGTEDRLREITAALTVDPAVPPLLGIDQEGGDVSRLPWDDFASSVTLKYEPPEATELAFAGRGALVQRAGISVNFGVVADITDDTGMFIYRRALGTTPESGASHVAAAVVGEEPEALSTLKHFPGHGAAPGDSHRGIPSTTESYDQWLQTDAVPFAAGIEAGAPLLMFGHLAYTSIDPNPATLSSEWHRIAREELGFDGVAITDDLGMLEASGLREYQDPVANAVAALAAGNDMLLSVLGTNSGTAAELTAGIVTAVESGALPAERLEEAAVRVMTLRLQTAGAGRGLVPCSSCAPAA